jgi:hypothetical protein
MPPEARSRATETAMLGIAAGIVLAIVEMAAAPGVGVPALMPVRMAASIVLGRPALSVSLEFAAIAGAVVHLVLSIVYGAIYGALNAAVEPGRHRKLADQAFAGVLYGTAIWLVNFQLIARVAYPWLLDAPQDLQWLMHALFFGLPLGLLYAAAARRIEV